MLTPRQNLIECIRGGSPDRYVNQFEAFSPFISGNPLLDSSLSNEGFMVDEWGATFRVMDNQPGFFPVHDAERTVCTDIAKWREQVTAPGNVDDPALWESAAAAAALVDRNEKFVTCALIPGIFERVHHLHEISETMIDLYEEPEAMHELIDCIVDWELRLAKAICSYVKPDAIFHHDDWGTQISTFMAPEMFAEYLLEPYKRVYGYYKQHGVELIVHHSDSFGETLVPYMIDMGVDIWQGTLRSSNDIPNLVDAYGGKISFMGGIESQIIDKPDWTEAEVQAEVSRAFESIGRTTYYIPCLTSGDDTGGYPGVYRRVSELIDERSQSDFR